MISRTHILTYQINIITKGTSKEREAGRYFKENTWWSDQHAHIVYEDFLFEIISFFL